MGRLSDMNASLCLAFPALAYAASPSSTCPSSAKRFALLLSNSPDLTNLRLLNVYISDQFTMQLPIAEYEASSGQNKDACDTECPAWFTRYTAHTVDLSALRKLQFWSDHGDQSVHLQRLLEAADELEDVVFHGLTSSTNGLDISHVPRIKCYFSNFHRVANEQAC
ncbi:hypothetical protein CPB85DRAFT_1442177 [Mucidula mucida]|nr:hypothetical protein CPB85DRAFT_1442177 [Mucidula mucida]